MAGVFVEFPAPQDFRSSRASPLLFRLDLPATAGKRGRTGVFAPTRPKKLRENFAQLFPYFCAEIGVARSKRWTVLTYTRKALQEKPGQWTSRYHCVNPGYNLQKKHCHVPPRVSREPNTCNSNTCALKTGGMSSARATTARAASATAARTSGVPPPRVSKTRPPTFGKACPERRGPLPLGAECVRAPTPLWKVVPITHRSSRAAHIPECTSNTRAPAQPAPSLPPSLLQWQRSALRAKGSNGRASAHGAALSGRGAPSAHGVALAEWRLPRTAGQH